MFTYKNHVLEFWYEKLDGMYYAYIPDYIEEDKLIQSNKIEKLFYLFVDEVDKYLEKENN